MAFVKCAYQDFCKNGHDKANCYLCIYYPYGRTLSPINKFVSCKCGSQSILCAHLHDADYCADCVPFDIPCSLFRRSVSFGNMKGGE